MPTSRARWLFAVVPLLFGCAHARLIPEDAKPGHRSVLLEGGGALLLVTANAWTASDEVAGATTPIHVTLLNLGPGSLKVRYRDFALTDDAGKLWAAIPPTDLLRRLYGQSQAGPPSLSSAGGGDGLFEPSARLLLSAEEEPSKRTLPEGELSPNERLDYWPTDYRRILDSALRRGELPPGWRSEGFLFFPEIRSAHELTLRYVVERDGAKVAELKTRFQVQP
ncbi:MAG: hypothetical protein ACYCWW_08450 [Deltaproteobacteria bacterium]